MKRTILFLAMVLISSIAMSQSKTVNDSTLLDGIKIDSDGIFRTVSKKASTDSTLFKVNGFNGKEDVWQRNGRLYVPRMPESGKYYRKYLTKAVKK